MNSPRYSFYADLPHPNPSPRREGLEIQDFTSSSLTGEGESLSVVKEGGEVMTTIPQLQKYHVGLSSSSIL
jgi:hypothetical protein